MAKRLVHFGAATTTACNHVGKLEPVTTTNQAKVTCPKCRKSLGLPKLATAADYRAHEAYVFAGGQLPFKQWIQLQKSTNF